MNEIPRFVPDMPLPPYTYVPGKQPHQISDPLGHSFGKARPTATLPNPQDWQHCREFLYGIDLFNHGFYWEAHEAWEACWHAAGRKGTTADFFKGLIKLAAAGVKQLEGKPEGVRSHSRRAAQLWRSVGESIHWSTSYFGLLVDNLIKIARSTAANGWPSSNPLLVPYADKDSEKA